MKKTAPEFINISNEVIDVMNDILHKKLAVSEDELSRSNWDEPLTGTTFRLSGVDLIYFLLEMEKAFKIRIDEKSFSSNGFTTLRKVGTIITACLQKS